MESTLFVTGGAGFIGSALVRYLLENTVHRVVVIDKLTYAGHLESFKEMKDHSRYFFEKVDIIDFSKLKDLFQKYRPQYVMHLAAETHVDHSISGPRAFIQTNIVGTFELLEATRDYWMSLTEDLKSRFRFLHVSTDEVFGMLGAEGFFTEESSYCPSSPYSASKASSDHLVRAWNHTYHLPTLITNCSNNYGPWQYPEKLIPVVILNALQRKPIPIYGEGKNVRDWLYVEDHVKALYLILREGKVGETYNIGGRCEKQNIDIVRDICCILDEIKPLSHNQKYEEGIVFVQDRAGHDWRYAIDCSKLENDLHWKTEETFHSGLYKTVKWYVNHQAWCEEIQQKKGKKDE